MQLLLEESEQIALAHEKVCGHPAYIDRRSQMEIDIPQELGDEGGEFRALGGMTRAKEGVQIIEQLGEQMGQDS